MLFEQTGALCALEKRMSGRKPLLAVEHSDVCERGVRNQPVLYDYYLVAVAFLCCKTIKTTAVCALERVVYPVVHNHLQTAYLAHCIGCVLHIYNALPIVQDPCLVELHVGRGRQYVGERRHRRISKEVAHRAAHS